MYYNSKASFGRLSEFAKSTKNVLLYGTQNPTSRPVVNSQMKNEPIAGKPLPKVEVKVTVPIVQDIPTQTDDITQMDLQQAIIWSEVLGKPLSKRRERRYYGN